MNSNSKRLKALFLFAIVCFTAAGRAANAQETRYVNDIFYVPLHSGESTKHRIVHKGLRSGTPLSLLESDETSGFSRVRTQKGVEGWIQSQFLVAEPIARIQLAQAQKRQAQLNEQIKALKAQYGDASKNKSRLDRELKALTENNTKLSDELSKIKKISANAIALDHNNRELLQKSELLKIQIEELTAENQRLSDKSSKEWFMYGIFAVCMGALLTALIPRLKIKRRSTEWA